MLVVVGVLAVCWVVGGLRLGPLMDTLVCDMFPRASGPEDYIELKVSGPCRLVLTPSGSTLVFGDSCAHIPRRAVLNTTELLIRNTKISVVRKGDLDNWTHLQALTIEMNEDLKTVEPGAFRYLTNLRNLSISNNYNLVSLAPDVFFGLTNLSELRLTKNGMTTVRDVAHCLTSDLLPNLVHLDLSENLFEIIEDSDFHPMKGSTVRSLCLTMCGLVFIHDNALSPFVNLESLKLGRNNLNTSVAAKLIVSLNSTAPKLRVLNLDANLMHKQPFALLKIISTTGISELELRENHFDPLVPGFFPEMPNLESLDLTDIMASGMANRTITTEIMPRLERLVLAKNRFSGFSPSLAITTLKELDLSQNSADSYSSSLFKLGLNQFFNMTSLLVLNLSRNVLFHIRVETFVGLSSLRVLLLQNCTLYRIDEFAFHYMPSLGFLDLSYNTFPSFYPLTSAMFSGLGNLVGLRLDYCSISNFSDPNVFSHLIKLEYLTLRGNSIVDLEARLFAPMVKLIKLDLSYNDILHWNTTLFTNNTDLKHLYMVSNQISEFSCQMLADFSKLEFLDLRDNPIVCDCQLILEVANYIAATNVSVEKLHLDDTENYCFSPRTWSNVRVMKYIGVHLEGRICDSEVGVIVAICMVSVVLVAVLLGGIFYYSRWHVRYWVFLLRQSLGCNHFPKARRQSDESYKYDAFVSYSNEDRNFVVRMVSMLEKQPPHLSLCVFERDFNIGEVISETVMASVETSRRIVLVLTDSFARSQWCLWEMSLAHHRRIFFRGPGPDPLVIVKLGEIMEAHMTPTLRHLMKTRIYLEWHRDPKKQRVFWQKLREALGPPRESV